MRLRGTRVPPYRGCRTSSPVAGTGAVQCCCGRPRYRRESRRAARRPYPAQGMKRTLPTATTSGSGGATNATRIVTQPPTRTGTGRLARHAPARGGPGHSWGEGDGNLPALDVGDTAFDSRAPDLGLVAQLVAHLSGRQEIRGSNPRRSTPRPLGVRRQRGWLKTGRSSFESEGGHSGTVGAVARSPHSQRGDHGFESHTVYGAIGTHGGLADR
jgi:hypothetical protein